MHTLRHTHAHADTHTYTRVHRHMGTRMHVHVCTHTHAHAHMCTHIHAHMRTHTAAFLGAPGGSSSSLESLSPDEEQEVPMAWSLHPCCPACSCPSLAAPATVMAILFLCWVYRAFIRAQALTLCLDPLSVSSVCGYLSVCLSWSHALPGGLCPLQGDVPSSADEDPPLPGWTPSFCGPTSSFFLVHPLGLPERGRNRHLSTSSPPETLRVELNPGSCLENSPTRSCLRTQDTGAGVHGDRRQAVHGRQAQQRGHKRPGRQLHRGGNRLAATAPALARPRQLRPRRRSAPGPTGQHVGLDGRQPREARWDRGGRNLVVFWLAILFLNLGCTSTAEAK